MQDSIPVIAIDGPSGVGKGTLSQSLAQHFAWHLLDSGAIYRVLALAAIKRNLALTDADSVAALALQLALRFTTDTDGVTVWLDDENVSAQIRTEEIGMAASQVAAHPIVREALLARQRAFLQAPGLIADGRDMGTVVFPEAPVKIFLDASVEARAQRRMKQLQQKGICAKFGEIMQEISERDQRDRNRAVAPLRPADDALLLDSTSLTIAEVFNQALTYIQQKLSK